MYRLFDNIIEKNRATSFAPTTKTLLDIFDIKNEILKNSKPDLASEGFATDKETFLYNCAYNLGLAKRDNSDIICVEQSSYLSFEIAKKEMKEDSELKNRVKQRVEKDSLEFCLDVKVLHIGDVLSNLIGFNKLQSMIKNSFVKFNVAIFNGNKKDTLDQNSKILALLGANIVKFEKQYNADGYEILEASKVLAFKLAGNVMLDAFDNAADFVIVDDARSFVMFEILQKKLESSVGRDIELSVFSVAQVVLMALGYTDIEKLGLVGHKIKTTLI